MLFMCLGKRISVGYDFDRGRNIRSQCFATFRFIGFMKRSFGSSDIMISAGSDSFIAQLYVILGISLTQRDPI
jgi:hypothetical protein